MTESAKAAQRIAVVRPKVVANAMTPILQALAEQGHALSIFENRDELIAAANTIPDTAVLFISTAVRCDRELMTRFPALRGVVFIAAGTDSIDMAAANELSIVVAHGGTPDNAESMAEATILLMLALSYRLHQTERMFKDGSPRPAMPSATMLKGKRIGLIGFGRIGRAVAKRLQNWQADIVAYTPAVRAEEANVKFVELDELLSTSDIVSVHAALNDKSRNMIGARELQLLKTGALFLNTARGELVDETALIACIRQGRLGGVALDTFVTEPLPMDSPLRSLPRVILTPHMVGHTTDTIISLRQAAVQNINAVVSGKQPPYVRNPAVLSNWPR